MKIFIFVSLILLIFQGTAIAHERSLKDVKIIENGEKTILRTRATTVEELFQKNDIILKTGDIVNLDPNHEITNNEIITIDRGFAVNVFPNDRQMSIRVSPQQTVYDLIDIVSYRTGNSYIYKGDPSRELTRAEAIWLIQVSEEYVTIEEPIGFETEIIYNNNIPYGQETIIKYGEYGLKSKDIIIQYENNEEVSREVLQTEILKEPVNEVKEVGTKRKVKTSTGYFKYTNSFSMQATAYSAQQPNLSNYTATGVPAVRGVVAVDPNVIPLGTRLYIPGYGHAVAADTGGAIRGKKIDLCFDTIYESIHFGRRDVKVYVLH